ncbi:uncharacterized protein LOC110394150 [Numida meleagris]|uniref:uncharacterized protein LOC110394150 n=1 Tax=Numida meleagris TaxID=8996 RepID=UPI000B3E08EF|nr:uncharacterized protein LOC110394150 [Numida meleagris]
MEVPSDWTCPICGHSQGDVAYTTPCLHQLCYGCALWWARKKPRCAICGHKIWTIRCSVRSDDDYIECPVPQPAVHSGYALQGEQEPAEPILLPPEYSFPPEIWAAFFQEHPQDLRPLLQWLQKEIRSMTVDGWWEVHARQSIVLGFLCKYGLDEAALQQELQLSFRGLTARFVRRLIIIATALYGPEIRRQQDRQDARAVGGHDSPTATPSPVTSRQEPPASSPGHSINSAGPGTEELPSNLPGGPGHPTTATVSSKEELQEEPDQVEAVGSSAPGRNCLAGEPRHSQKRKACSSPQDSSPPRKRPRRQ